MLFFDEADAIASRRSSSVDHAQLREANLVVNVLLQELESFSGVVIFATNLAANFDPAFERRIRAHVLFEMPGVTERERDLARADAPALTPLAAGRGLPGAGGTLRGERRRHPQRRAEGGAGRCRRARTATRRSASRQRHLDEGMRDVLAGKQVMRQSLFDAMDVPLAGWSEAAARMQKTTQAALVAAVLALLAAAVALTLVLAGR